MSVLDVVLLGAGGPAGVNFARAASAAGFSVWGVEENPLHVPFARKYCRGVWDRPHTSVAATEAVWYAQPDSQVLALARSRHLRSFLPGTAALEVASSKLATGKVLAERGLRAEPIEISDCNCPKLEQAAEKFGFPFWLRASHGAGARGATLVNKLETARSWIEYWKSREEKIRWIAEEHLPGREFCWTSVWRYGKLYASFTRERLEWIYPHVSPSGRTGTPSVSRVVHSPDANMVGLMSVEAISPEPNGVYCVDMVEDKDGFIKPTEVNAGRFATTSPLYYQVGPNLVGLYIRLAQGEDVKPLGKDIYPEGKTLYRHIDCGEAWSD